MLVKVVVVAATVEEGDNGEAGSDVSWVFLSSPCPLDASGSFSLLLPDPCGMSSVSGRNGDAGAEGVDTVDKGVLLFRFRFFLLLEDEERPVAVFSSSYVLLEETTGELGDDLVAGNDDDLFRSTLFRECLRYIAS